MTNELDRKIMTKFVGLKVKIYNSLIDDSSEDKKAKGTKKCVTKRKLKFESYKNCLEATQLDDKISIQKEIKLTQIVLQKDYKEFIKYNKLLLKTQQRFRSDRHNVFTEEIN